MELRQPTDPRPPVLARPAMSTARLVLWIIGIGAFVLLAALFWITV
jgi:hypothetical protein